MIMNSIIIFFNNIILEEFLYKYELNLNQIN